MLSGIPFEQEGLSGRGMRAQMLCNMILNNQLVHDLSQAGKCSQGCYFTQDLIFKQQTVPKTDILLQTP